MTHRIETYAITGRAVPAKNGVWVNVTDHIEHIERVNAENERVIAHLGDLLAHQIDQTEAWRTAATESLPIVTGLRTELAAARAELARLRLQVEDRVHDC